MKRAIRYALLAVLAAALFFAGVAMGTRHATSFWLSILEQEVVGSLSSSIETLADLRTGEEDRAAARLEGRLQRAVVSLPGQRSWEEIPEGTRTALVRAKTYLERHPPQDTDGGLDAALAAIPNEASDPDTASGGR